MQHIEITEISDSGLRYKSKQAGSPYQGLGSTGETMSCIKCGQHRLRRHGVHKRSRTMLMFFCVDCKPAKSPAQG